MPVSTFSRAAAARQTRSGVTHLVASGLLWGTGGLIGRLLDRAGGMHPLAVAAYRLAVGGAVLVVLLAATGARRPCGRAAWIRVAAVGLLSAQFQACYFTAVSLTSVSLATLITIGSAPVMVLGVELARRQRRLGPLPAVIAGLALVGLALLAGVRLPGVSEGATLASAGMAALSGAGFAALTLIGSRPVPGLDDLAVTGFGFVLGGLALAPLAAAYGGLGFHPGAAALALLAALGTGPTAVAYVLYFRGLRGATPGTAALLTLLEPLTAAVLGTLVLGDRLGAAGAVGAALLGAAVLLTVRTQR